MVPTNPTKATLPTAMAMMYASWLELPPSSALSRVGSASAPPRGVTPRISCTVAKYSNPDPSRPSVPSSMAWSARAPSWDTTAPPLTVKKLRHMESKLTSSAARWTSVGSNLPLMRRSTWRVFSSSSSAASSSGSVPSSSASFSSLSLFFCSALNDNNDDKFRFLRLLPSNIFWPVTSNATSYTTGTVSWNRSARNAAATSSKATIWRLFMISRDEGTDLRLTRTHRSRTMGESSSPTPSRVSPSFPTSAVGSDVGSSVSFTLFMMASIFLVGEGVGLTGAGVRRGVGRRVGRGVGRLVGF
mmetsp:Transcript_10572/g.24877  ORF Transcript_10572/g.24877 Transcript_10572/m.24877 type:complete len:301 (-) Transcript_10572:707-1609(-)